MVFDKTLISVNKNVFKGRKMIVMMSLRCQSWTMMWFPLPWPRVQRPGVAPALPSSITLTTRKTPTSEWARSFIWIVKWLAMLWCWFYNHTKSANWKWVPDRYEPRSKLSGFCVQWVWELSRIEFNHMRPMVKQLCRNVHKFVAADSECVRWKFPRIWWTKA